MKLLILLLLCSIELNAQYSDFYANISKERYDSIVNFTWYPGEMFFMDGTSRKGLIHKASSLPRSFITIIQIKDSLNGKIEYLSPHKIQGWYDIHKKDTAWFVMMDINLSQKVNLKPLKILENGDLSLLLYAWLEKYTDKTSFFNSRMYELHWSYYLFKNDELRKIYDLRRDLKLSIKDNLKALNYYKKNKRGLKGDCMYFYLIELIKIYNE